MRVETGAEVTIVVLIYRSLKWLDFVMQGVDSSKNDTKYRWLVVANDATEEVKNDPRVDVVFDNADPNEFYINRVYRAWNEGVLNASTQLVVMMNSDMYASDYWLDALVESREDYPQSVATSLLIESGRLESGMPEHVRDFGLNPDEFKHEQFKKRSLELRGEEHGWNVDYEPGRLYMPILIDRQEFFDVGSYPEGNPPGTTGDKDLIRRYKEAGFEHVTALGSVVYHVCLGEQEWPSS